MSTKISVFLTIMGTWKKSIYSLSKMTSDWLKTTNKGRFQQSLYTEYGAVQKIFFRGLEFNNFKTYYQHNPAL